MIRAAHNNTVTVKYTGKLADGTIFDASPDDRPLNFIIGRAEVIKPDQAYGESSPDLMEEISRADLPEDLVLNEGGQLEVTQEDGSIVLLMINKVTDDTVTLDANHPLAGKTLTFTIELLEVDTEPPKELPPLFAGALESGRFH